MLTLKAAVKHANNMTKLHKQQWIVGMTPSNARCNQPPANLFNEGRWIAIAEAERAEYASGGMTFPNPMPPSLNKCPWS